MTIGQVDAIAQGKIYTGNQALGLGLVDQIGSLQTAVDKVGVLRGSDGVTRFANTRWLCHEPVSQQLYGCS
jgi:protease-4